MVHCRGLLTCAVMCFAVVTWARHGAALGDGGATRTQLKKIPDFIKVCFTNEPEFNDCVTKSVEIIRPRLVEGIAELNVPSIEPLVIPELVAVQGGGLRIRAKNVKAYGCSNFDIHDMDVKLDSNEISFMLDFPMLHIDALYKVDGRILLLPIMGNGPMKANFTDCKAVVNLRGTVVERDGERYYHVDYFNVKIKVSGGTIHLKNLFGGDPTLGNVVNSVLNNNFQTFVREIIPSIESALSDIMMEITNNIVNVFTYDQLLPKA